MKPWEESWEAPKSKGKATPAPEPVQVATVAANVAGPKPWEEEWEKPKGKAASADGRNPNMITSVGAGLGKGVGTVALGAQRYLGKGLSALGADETGGWLQRDAEQGQAKLEAENLPFKQANPTSNALGEVGGNVLATLPVGGALGSVAKAAGAPALGNALASGGMTLGKTGGNALVNMGTRMAGGAITGGASAALVDPEAATTGAVIGGVLPPLVSGAGALGNALARTMRGPGAAPGVADAAKAARAAGYVIPPTQVDPTLSNRLLEGFSGKLTTAQNASARNALVTDDLVKRELGIAADKALDVDALEAVRKEAGKAYGAISDLGRLNVRGTDVPSGIKVKEYTDPLMNSFREVDAGEVVRAWKQANHDATGYYRAYGRDANPETLAKAKKAASEAKSIDDFMQASLEKMGNSDLVAALKDARVRIAKTYSAEAAMNPVTGTVDARKLAKQLEKGKVLSGGLKEAADFAGRFPKAAQTVEGMGSLPQTSPLDWGAAVMASAASGSPLPMVGVLARPAARQLTLSNAFQNRLVQSRTAAPQLQLTPEIRNALLQGVYQGSPVAGAEGLAMFSGSRTQTRQR